MTLSFSNKIKRRKTVMKMSKSQILNLAVGALTLLGMYLGSKAQDAEIKELKAEIKAEIKEEKERK